ncbi:MAG: Brp/Blh family beta-carotene 15,15'-dioxygenase [Flavobacteriaceae bacterium]|nr:Brp/Blh family beta-carotene 15,15'-dioxygenase [Flavobacteriaceae bacterium]
MKIYVIAIFSSVLAIVLNFLLKNYYLDILALILVLTVGIAHGANDLLIIKKIKKNKHSYELNKYTFGYVSMVVLVLALFYFLPWLILTGFVFISAYHFGEQQLQISKKILHASSKIKTLFFIYGLSVLLGLFYFNLNFTREIIFDLIKVNIPEVYFTSGFFISLSITFLVFIFLLIKKLLQPLQVVQEILSLILIFIVFYYSELLFGFAIYFVFWHTIPSLRDQINYLFENQSKQKFLLYVKNAFPFWLISVIGLVVLYYLFGSENMFLSIMFAFIAAVTFPHVIVIERMFSKIKN